MKRYSILLTLLFFQTIAFSQISYKEMDLNQIRNSSANLLTDYDISPDGDTLMNEKVLNVFFAKSITSYFSSSSNLTLSKAHAFIDNSDDRLSVGGTFTNQRNKLDKLSHIIQAGIKANVKDGFSTFFKDGDLQKDIGFSFKYTVLGKGTISQDTASSNNQKLRNRSYGNYTIEQLNLERNNKIAAFEKNIASYSSLDDTEEKKELRAFYESIDKEYVLKYAEAEAKYIDEKKLYTWAWDWWISFESYIPFTQSEYNFSKDINSSNFETENYRPFEFKITPTFLAIIPSIGKVFISPKVNIYQNNVVKTEAVKSTNYQDYINQGGLDTLNTALLNSDKVYLGSFDEFWTYQYGIQLAYFLPGKANFIGLSGEFNWEKGGGGYSSKNWKVGVPISLKDEEGKPKVNFELQLRKRNDLKSVGISVGLPFGSLIY